MSIWQDFVDQFGTIPQLHGARCYGLTELFDRTIQSTRDNPAEDVEYARRRALDLCCECPALNDCRAWLNTLPLDKRPPGVVAGRINNLNGHHAHDQRRT